MITKRLLKKIEFIWHVFVILIIIGAFSVQWRGLFGGGENQIEGNQFERYLLIFLYGVSIISLLFQLSKLVFLFTRTYLLWLLVLLVFLSFSWSGLPNVTLRRAISILLATLYATVLFFRYKPEKLLDILFVVFLVIIVSSLIVAVFYPEMGLMGGKYVGSWQGVMSHKNYLGRICVIAIMVFLFKLSTAKGIRKVLILLLITVSGFMLIKSNSATAFVLFVILLFSAWMTNLAAGLRKNWPIFMLFMVSLLLITSLLVISEYTSILDIIGRDATLTGRLPLWKNIFPYVMDKFWFGYGYRVFWVDPAGPYPFIWSAVHWQPLHAHNGYIDLVLNIGFTGLMIVLIVFIELLTKTFNSLLKSKELKFHKFSFMHFLLFFSILIFFNSFSESMILNGDINNAFYWVFLSYAYFWAKTEKFKKEIDN